jgi:probable rRNA maturation factor
MRVDIADPDGRLTPPARAWLAARSAAAIGTVARSGEVRARVVGDAEMAGAHERHTGVAGTTDVLTFDLSQEPRAESAADIGHPSHRALDADLLICADEAQRHATTRGHSIERELLLYILHGALHCLGHDDHDEAAAARMHAVEDRVLEAIGVGATYAPAGGQE